MRLTAFGMLLTALWSSASAPRAAQSLPIDATITGHVIDGGTQAPIAGARVMLLPAPAAGRVTGPMGIPTQAVTGDDGVYALRGVTAGRYRVQVQKPGFVSPSPAEPSWVQVDAGQAIAGPDVRLVRGAVITGRVLDARGDGLPELMVTAVQKATGGFGRGRGAPAIPAGQPAQTNDIGEFRITGLPEGQYYVTASPRPASPFGESSASGASSPIATFYPGATEIAGAQVITVAAGQTVGGLEFTILSVRGFTVSGVVVDEMNRPVGGAMVMLMPAQLAVVGPGPRGSGRTQADGTFTIGGVAPGAYRLNASVPVTVPSGGTATSSGGGTVITWGGGTATAGLRGGVASGAGGLVTYSSSSGPASSIQVTVGDADVAGVTVVVRTSQ